jgi:O-antigen/teichoic acid export membrane protein
MSSRHLSNVFWSGPAVVAVHVLLWVTVNALFSDALVQRAVLDNATFSSAFWASLGVGVIAAIAQFGLALPLAAWLSDERLVHMSAVLALPLPLVGAAGPIQGLLTRNRAYKALAGRTVIGQGVGTGVGIAAALAGAGAWAIVWQQVVISSAGAIALLVNSPDRPRCILRRRDLTSMMRVGLPLTASTLVHGRYRVFALLIGGTAGAAALGQVHMAFRLVDTVRDLAFTAQWRLMLPLLSERQNDMPELHAGMDRCLAWSSLLAFPLCCAMALSIQPLVRLLLGPVWQETGLAALPLIGLTAWLFLAFPAGVAVIARGEARYTLIANLAGIIATVLAVLVFKPASPLQAVLAWLAAQFFVSPYVLCTNARILRTDLLRPLQAGLPLLAAASVATAAAFVLPHAFGEPASPLLLIAVRILTAAAIGLPVAFLLTGRPARFSGGSGPPAVLSRQASPDRRRAGG